MQVTQEKRPGSRVGLTIVVDAEQVKKTYEKTVRQLVQSVQVQGFRKGKAPRQLVIGQVGSQRVTVSALDEIINNSIREAMKAEDISPVSQFELETSFDEMLAAFNGSTDLSFTGSVEVYPDVSLGSYTGLELTATRVDPDPAQVDEKIEGWRDQRATLVPVEAERPCQMGDVAIIDFEGFDEEGNPLEGTSAEEFQLELKEDGFIPGFVAGIVGMEIEETREVEATFPEDYFQTELAGKKAKFKIVLHDLKEKELPELNEAFVEELTRGEMKTIEELREYLTRTNADEARQACLNALDDAIIDAVTQQISFDMPKSMMTEEVNKDISRSLREIQGMMNLSASDVERFLAQLPEENRAKLMEQFQPKAEQRLQRSLALGEIVRREGIQVGRTELALAVEQTIQNAQTSLAKTDRRRIESVIEERLLTNKVIKWLRDQNTVSWVDADGNPVESPLQDPPVAEDLEATTVEGVTGDIDTTIEATVLAEDPIEDAAVAEDPVVEEDPVEDASSEEEE